MPPMLWAYGALGLAIVLEVIATSSLQASQQFTKPLPSLIVAAGYAGAFYLLSHVLKHVPVGIAYATWSGLGIVLISLAGWLVFKQRLDVPALIGLALIVAGVVIVNGFSKSATH